MGTAGNRTSDRELALTLRDTIIRAFRQLAVKRVCRTAPAHDVPYKAGPPFGGIGKAIHNGRVHLETETFMFSSPPICQMSALQPFSPSSKREFST